ncbi:hypothetical protein ASPFODRAFT_62964 [Aspergillus luchuensis CBS 106.47]|uniref:Uncharacterized protein n=1 Tax=Aspergillus luchuensis (strain CBS 106.47) TaxID=1137211 RepID=A0A1M3TAR8_ASPLC|nr:hypothetical protein ASPFODRAFT_62964 [Aspergillus luchuensis CBS 106.47]
MVISPDSGVSWMTRAQARALSQPTMKQWVGVQTSDKFYTLGPGSQLRRMSRTVRVSANLRPEETLYQLPRTFSSPHDALNPSMIHQLSLSALWTLLNLWLIKRGISGRLSGSSTLDPERPSVVVIVVVMEYVVLLKAYSFYYVHGRLQRAATVAEWAPAAIVLLDWALEFPGQSGDLHKPG